MYVYIFGEGIPHLHVHLAPHRSGDALNDQIIRGEVVKVQHESGVTRLINKDFPPLSEDIQWEVAERIRRRRKTILENP